MQRTALFLVRSLALTLVALCLLLTVFNAVIAFGKQGVAAWPGVLLLAAISAWAAICILPLWKRLPGWRVAVWLGVVLLPLLAVLAPGSPISVVVRPA